MKINTSPILIAALLGSISAASATIVANNVIGLDFGPTAATNNYNSLSAINSGSTSLVELSSGTVISGVSVTTSSWAFTNDDADHLLGTGPASSNAVSYTHLTLPTIA